MLSVQSAESNEPVSATIRTRSRLDKGEFRNGRTPARYGDGMSRSRAKFTQADVARAIRAAKKAGASDITIRADGSIAIGLAPTDARETTRTELATSDDIVL